MQSNKYVLLLSGLACAGLAAMSLLWAFQFHEVSVENSQTEEMDFYRSTISEQLGPMFAKNIWPTAADITLEGQRKNVNLSYTFDNDLQEAADRLLHAYKPDYGALVVMDAETGKVLALSSFQKTLAQQSPHLALRGTFPAASIFKIVTATAAVDKYSLSPDTIVLFNGGNHTLYRNNVMSDKRTKWTRMMTLREAFARSINTVFGRLSLERLQPDDLREYAIRFGFNKMIKSDLPFDAGFTEIPEEKNYALTEIASGYNRVTTMSPIQGAMIAASVANNGIMRIPYVVESMKDQTGSPIMQAKPITAAVTMTPEGAQRLKVLMEATIARGTSHRSFRPLLRDRRFRELELGGKTGSLTGTDPKGRVEWFVGYAIGENQKLAVAALTVNVDKWTVKSSHLAQSLFKTHFKEQFTKSNEKFFQTTARDL